MKKLLSVLLLCPTLAFGAVVASMNNQGGGKIVLTDEQCVHKGKTYKGLLRSYFYTAEGITGEGCWVLEDESITVVWHMGETRRYPASNFDIRKRGNNL